MIYLFECYACKKTTERITNDYNLKHTVCKHCGAQAKKVPAINANLNKTWAKQARGVK